MATDNPNIVEERAESEIEQIERAARKLADALEQVIDVECTHCLNAIELRVIDGDEVDGLEAFCRSCQWRFLHGEALYMEDEARMKAEAERLIDAGVVDDPRWPEIEAEMRKHRLYAPWPLNPPDTITPRQLTRLEAETVVATHKATLAATRAAEPPADTQAVA